ncbi:RNA-binding protein 41-like [Homarus americanus]|uniref:RNA-binding protein 41-like n=1 Tax=Homarus americanus TaxID=6706 RepID=A0A8J5N7C4_HOMAM|nr:RNA-binding protein 41-like [Homarus americanus]KAG7174535.1 RNA-binding protein 41-like [Homarus americanus]
MASVTYNNAKKYRFLGLEEEETEKPQTNTLREKIMKNLVRRQLATHTSLEQQLQNQRNFMRTTAEESITASTSGLSSCEDYKNLEASLNVKQILKSSGLSESEIDLLMNENASNTSLEAPQAREERLVAIEDKLLKRQEQLEAFLCKQEHFNGAVPLNRHDFEEECIVVPNSAVAEKLTACLVRLQPHQDDTIPADHPIHYIKQLEEDLFPREAANNDANPQKRDIGECSTEGPARKSRKKLQSDIIYLSEKPKSLWDMKKIPKVVKSHQTYSPFLPEDNVEDEKSNICGIREKHKKLIANKTKPFVLTLTNSDLIPLESIKSNKKSIEELRNMEKFKKYDPGKPSPVLYIKNLSHKTTPQDLASLMGHFEILNGPKIMYRILDGRMRGQAFVTFQNEEVATNAFIVCNGYILHDKPIVIEYGRK